MDHHAATTAAASVSVEAVVTRADGRVEHLGCVAYWHRSPWRRLAWRLAQLLRGRRPGSVAPPDITRS